MPVSGNPNEARRVPTIQSHASASSDAAAEREPVDLRDDDFRRLRELRAGARVRGA